MSFLILRTHTARLLCLIGALACAGVAGAQPFGAGRTDPGASGAVGARPPDHFA